MANDKQAIKLAGNVIAAIAYEKTVGGVVKPKQQRVLNYLQIKETESGQIITDPERLYLAPDEPFQIYLEIMHKFYTDQGFEIPAFGYCPLLMAEDQTRKAKQALIDYCKQFTGIAYSDLFTNFPDNYNQYVDMTLRLLASKVKKQFDHEIQK